MILAWAPWHSDKYVLTHLKHTPRMVLGTGFDGFALDLIDIKQESIDHSKLPPPETDAAKLASSFPMGKKDADHLSALTRMIGISLTRCHRVCQRRAAIPSFTVAQGKHVQKNVEVFLTGLNGIQHRRVTISLPTDALFQQAKPYPVHLPCDLFYTTGDNGVVKLLGIFVYCVHGSQGRYLRGRGGEVPLTAAYALDLALDYAVALQPHAKPTPRRFAHTLAAWPARGLTQRQFQFELRQLRRREMEGGASPGSLQDLPASHIFWIEQLELRPPAATQNSGSQTILSRYCSALSSYYRRSMSPEAKKRRRERIAETIAGWSSERKDQHLKLRAVTSVKGGENSWKYHSQEEKDDRVRRTFDTADENGLTGRDKAAITRRAKATGLAGAHASSSETPLRAGDMVSVRLLYDKSTGSFEWSQDTSRGFDSKDVADDGLRIDGERGQIMTRGEFAAVSTVVSPKNPVEAWFCHTRSQ